MKNKLLTYSVTALLGIAGLSATAQTSWLITGNGNITTSNFIGTTNAQPIIFKTNNIERMRLSKNGQLGIGITTPNYPLHIQNPTSQLGVSVINNFSGTEDRIGV